MVIYFSGTGNSKFVAEKIAGETDDIPISANDYIKSKKMGNFEGEKRVVLVSPLYVFAPPYVFTDFIKNSEFSPLSNLWFVMTGAGETSASDVFWKNICKSKNLNYMGTAHIAMPQNYIIYFKTLTASENSEIIKSALPKIEALSETVRKGKKFEEKATSAFVYLITKATIKPFFKFFAKSKAFYTDNKCISCGKCQQLCPMNNISVKDGKPIWGKNCIHCMACINLCPSKSIEYGNKTQGKPRYNIKESIA